MIQFNLLPDVKLQYIKARRSKQLVMLISVSLAATALAVLILLFINVRLQKSHMGHLTNDINADSKTLKKKPDLDKVLTIQNQLNKLGDLHAKKQATSRYYDYIIQMTPLDIRIAKAGVDFEANTMTFEGAAPTFSSINKFVDTLKFTDYVVANSKESGKRAFSEVVLKTFGRDEKAATYQIELKFDPAIFDINNEVTLKPSTTTTTRSETEKPLFEANPVQEINR